MPLGAFKAALMGTAGVSTADVVLLATATADDTATISFTSDITSTYGEYIFGFYNVDGGETRLTFQTSTDSGSNYDTTVTSTWFYSRLQENHGGATLSYYTANDQAQGTAFQLLNVNLKDDADAGLSGKLHLFNPASTTYVKHFMARTEILQSGDSTFDAFVAGYFNTTSAIDAIQFKMLSGNMSAGKIKMWGVK